MQEAGMLSSEDIAAQQELLATYRRNIRVLLVQAAQHGGEMSAPLPIANNLSEARENIERIKNVLRASSCNVEDHPDDAPPQRRDLDQAIVKQAAHVSEDDRSQVLRRAKHATAILQGAQILWVDDTPSNNIYERRLLRSLGVFVDLARSTAEAVEMLQDAKYDAVISDMAQDGNPEAGIQLLSEMRKRNLYRWTIFYIGHVDMERGTPPYAFGIVDRPDHLLHYLIDVLERERL
jgi:CheY-like chemotaxis protein